MTQIRYVAQESDVSRPRGLYNPKTRTDKATMKFTYSSVTGHKLVDLKT